MRRALLAALGACVLLCALCGPAAAAEGWRSEQPIPGGSAVPVALGPVYDVEFWAPNRGLLITAEGLWAYDGTGWHRYSTVCGGTAARIAWAGPLDFWTISDQPIGQSGVDPGREGPGRSLCHFQDGAVVASYAVPLGRSTSYEQMDAAACTGPEDCWFGGERLPGTLNTGAFHLHWDGHALTPVPSLTQFEAGLADPDRAVADMAASEGSVYESVRVDGNEVAGESADEPLLLHQIFPGTPPAFVPVLPSTPIAYGGLPPATWEPLRLSSAGPGLWAATGTADVNQPASPLVFRLGPGGLEELPLSGTSPLLEPSTQVTSLAAEPGGAATWVGFSAPTDGGFGIPAPARLTRVLAGGEVEETTTLPAPGEGLARKGKAGPIACPAPGQCWLATEKGWLFHLGEDLPRDEAPQMHGLITYRPPDSSTPIHALDTIPEDNSGSEPAAEKAPLTEPRPTRPRHAAPSLVLAVRQRTLGADLLELRFTLTARARVELLAKRGGKTVAHTRPRVLAKGRHVLRLKLDPKRWPTEIHLEAHAAHASKGKAKASALALLAPAPCLGVGR